MPCIEPSAWHLLPVGAHRPTPADPPACLPLRQILLNIKRGNSGELSCEHGPQPPGRALPCPACPARPCCPAPAHGGGLPARAAALATPPAPRRLPNQSALRSARSAVLLAVVCGQPHAGVHLGHPGGGPPHPRLRGHPGALSTPALLTSAQPAPMSEMAGSRWRGATACDAGTRAPQCILRIASRWTRRPDAPLNTPAGGAQRHPQLAVRGHGAGAAAGACGGGSGSATGGGLVPAAPLACLPAREAAVVMYVQRIDPV